MTKQGKSKNILSFTISKNGKKNTTEKINKVQIGDVIVYLDELNEKINNNPYNNNSNKVSYNIRHNDNGDLEIIVNNLFEIISNIHNTLQINIIIYF